MTKNIGRIEQILRILVGLALIAMVFVGPQTPWGWIGVILVVTGLINFCPLWKIFGINTAK